MRYTKEEVATARARLLDILRPGDTVYTVLNSVSRSGMSRDITMYKIGPDGKSWLSGYASKMLGEALTQRDGIKVQGCGMDMGFELVYRLGRALWPEGFKVEGTGRNGDTSGWDNDGGYALRQSWL